MTAPKHTPGPWNSEGPDDFGDHNIHEPTCRLAIGAVVPNMRPDEEVAANARLIAAAPDMLDALHALLSALDQEIIDRLDDAIWVSSQLEPAKLAALLNARDAARAAIAKAEGREG